MAKFRKKPVVIEAVYYDEPTSRSGWATSVLEAHPWLEDAYDRDDNVLTNYEKDGVRWIGIKTLEGTMRCDVGDWIIRGVKGELYPCKHDIFAATYEPVE